MSSKFIDIKSFSLLVLGAALLTGAGTLVAYSVNSQQTSMPAAPEFATLHQPESIIDAPEAAKAWKSLLAAADSGDEAALRQYVAAAGPESNQLAEAFCNLILQISAAHGATSQQFGELASDHAAFFAHHNAEVYARSLNERIATVCAILPVCGDNYEPTPVEMQRIAGHWQVIVGRSLRGSAAGESTFAMIDRLDRSAQVLRTAAAQIRAGAYESADEAVYAIQNGLWHVGLQAN